MVLVVGPGFMRPWWNAGAWLARTWTRDAPAARRLRPILAVAGAQTPKSPRRIRVARRKTAALLYSRFDVQTLVVCYGCKKRHSGKMATGLSLRNSSASRVADRFTCGLFGQAASSTA